MKHRQWKRHLALTAAFLALALGLIAYTDRVLWDKKGTIMGFYEEPRNSIDVFYIGGSHTNAAVCPTRLYTEYGYTGYVLYSWSQPIWTAYHYLLEGLKTQSPRVVVLDGMGLVYGNTYMSDVDMNTVSDDYSLLIKPGLNRLALAVAMQRCQTGHRPFYRYASLLRYHNRWKALTADDVLWPLVRYRTTGKGFGPLYTTESFEAPQPPQPLAANEAIYAPCQEYLEKILALCQKRGIAVVLVNYPYLASETEYGIYEACRQTAARYGAACVDYLLPQTAAEAGFDYGADMAEHAHVNYKGAEKITAHLGAYLAAHFDLPDHRGDPAYSRWAEDAAAEERNLQEMNLRLTFDLAELLEKARSGGYLVLGATAGDLSEGDPSAVQAALDAHGISTEAFAGAGQTAFALLPNGKILQNTGEEAAVTVETADGTQVQALAAGEEAVLLAKPRAEVASAAAEPADVSRHRSGLNLAVVDAATGELVFSLSFSPDQGWAGYTE